MSSMNVDYTCTDFSNNRTGHLKLKFSSVFPQKPFVSEGESEIPWFVSVIVFEVVTLSVQAFAMEKEK